MNNNFASELASEGRDMTQQPKDKNVLCMEKVKNILYEIL